MPSRGPIVIHCSMAVCAWGRGRGGRGREKERRGEKRERKEEGGEGGRERGEEETSLHLSEAGVAVRWLLDLGPVPMDSSRGEESNGAGASSKKRL